MKEQLITFDTAKLAKEKGFFIHTKYYYNSDNPLSNNIELKSRGWTTEESEGIVYTRIHEESGLLTYQIDSINNAPTQSLLQKWLREVHIIEVYVVPYSVSGGHAMRGGKGFYEVVVDKSVTTWSGHKTYEEALEEGLQEALKLI